MKKEHVNTIRNMNTIENIAVVLCSVLEILKSQKKEIFDYKRKINITKSYEYFLICLPK